jgi:tRNA guanosine-2'-O-methyltransferase
MQRKLIPSDHLELAVAEEVLSRSLNVVGRRKQDVVVCASLIDKVPNLGGLARTCEIFAATRLLLPNIRVLGMDMFKSISVTAAEWLDIQELRPEHTASFLRSAKAQGYAVVGLEQTAASQSLARVKLPKKMVLLLGEERKGVPPELLGLVDVLVEIPQLGLLRSLNVHVSGALLLWEYTRQHALS